MRIEIHVRGNGKTTRARQEFEVRRVDSLPDGPDQWYENMSWHLANAKLKPDSPRFRNNIRSWLSRQRYAPRYRHLIVVTYDGSVYEVTELSGEILFHFIPKE